MIDAARIARPGQTLIADNRYRSTAFEADLSDVGITVARPATRSEAPRPGARFLRPLRQIIESINETLKGQLSLERHKGRTKAGVAARIATRLLALTAAIWHNETYRVSLLGLPAPSARGLRSGSMLDGDSTRLVALCLLSDVSRRVWGRQERSCLEGSLTVSTRL